MPLCSLYSWQVSNTLLIPGTFWHIQQRYFTSLNPSNHCSPFRIQAAQNQVKFILSLHLSVKVHHLSLVCFSLSRPKLQQKILFNNSISSIFDSHPRHISHMNCRFSFQRGAIFHWILPPPYLTSWENIAQSICYAMLEKEVMKATIFTSLPPYCFVLNPDQRKDNLSFLETKYFYSIYL